MFVAIHVIAIKLNSINYKTVRATKLHKDT